MNYAEIAIGTGKFLDDHNGSVSAAATAVIALLTLMLVIVTNRQARLTRASIDLARQEFAATHRPKSLCNRSCSIGVPAKREPITST